MCKRHGKVAASGLQLPLHWSRPCLDPDSRAGKLKSATGARCLWVSHAPGPASFPTHLCPGEITVLTHEAAFLVWEVQGSVPPILPHRSPSVGQGRFKNKAL